jgi:uncharacterized protein YdhG (YjbR/CyaY superfamily)
MKATSGPATINAYIADFPRATQTVLKRVRAAIRKALPGAAESISYRIPTFRIEGRPVIYFAGFKQHYSVYPFTTTLIDAFSREAQQYELSHKGTIRFSYDDPVPERFIARIAKFRAREAAARAGAGRGARARTAARR